ncbi:MAG: LysR substrate-binding domain-containing protein [Caulobacteraceae bacterium]
MTARLTANPGRSSAAQSGWEGVSAAIAWRESHTPFPLQDAGRPRLTIGLCSSLSSGLLRELVRRLLVSPSPPELAFVEGSAAHILQAARRREIDVGFVYGDHDWSKLDHERLWRERILAAMPETHPLAAGVDVPSDQLAEQPLLVRGAVTDYAAQAAFVRQVLGRQPARLSCLRVDRETLLELAGLGLGVTLVADSSLGTFHPGVVYRPICGAADAVAFSVVWKSAGGNPALGPLLATARALCARPRLVPIQVEV